MTDLGKLLRKLGACEEAVRWANGKKLSEAWAICERPDWMLWLCGKMEGKDGWPTRQQIVLVACLFAEDALPLYERRYLNDDRPRKAIETARKWANGEATIEEVRKARAAAYAAAAAYAYAYAAAYAYAYAAAYATGVRLRKQKEYAGIIRQELKIPVEVKP